MQNNIQIFESTEFGTVRVVEENGQPWWVLKDVCKALDIENPRFVRTRLDDDEVGSFNLPHPQSLDKWLKMTCINESGLYAVILRSDKPKARAFRKWVTSDILPSIRKHQVYIAPETLKRMREDQIFADDLLKILTDAQEINRSLVGFVEVMHPKAEYYDAILQCPYALPVTIIARDYGMTAQAFNKLLYSLRIQYKVGKTWVLYAAYADLGYTLSSTHLTDGEEVTVHTQWTQIGRQFLYARLKQHGILPTAQTLMAELMQTELQGTCP